MQNLNPYLDPILKEIDHYLNAFPCTTEHQIIKHLQAECIAPFEHLNLAHAKELFNAHFLCMHALYHLKYNYLQAKSFELMIQSVRVERIAFSQSTHITTDTLLHTTDPLADYYLNSRHYFETQEEDITDMLKAFWDKYLAQDQKQDALKTLNLPHEASAKMIKDRYKRLAQKHHPDKGGCADMFNKIRQAKETLDHFT